MEVYGIIGKQLGHSFSPSYFKKKFQTLKYDAEYLKFELDDIAEFPDLVKNINQLKGLNVTIPYKESIIPFLNELDPVARAIGAVNTVKVERTERDIKLVGYNTDIIGFRKAIESFLADYKIKSALILGTGGSSKAVAYGLKQMGVECQFVSRSPKENQLPYQSLNEEIIKRHLLIVNTAPLGMYPDIDQCPELPYQFLSDQHFLFDLVYNPEHTLFMKRGIEYGARVENGLGMLNFQAEESWAIWQDT